MKNILIAALIAGACGSACAAGFADLQGLRAADVRGLKAFEDLHDPAASPVAADSEIAGFRIKKLDAAGIKDYKITRKGARSASQADYADKAAAFSTRITFGPITAAQFESLKKSFGGLSAVQYDDPARKSWDLVDFLPPLLQALDGRRFAHSAMDYNELPADNPLRPVLDANRMQPYLLMQTNCHATAYEAARSIAAGEARPAFGVYILGSITAMDLYDLAGGYPAKPDLSIVPVDKAAERNAGRRLGDIVVLGPEYGTPLHSAVWLDDDLYFEKTDSLDGSPYRMVTYADMMSVGGLAAAMQNEFKPGGLRFVRLDPARARGSAEMLAGNASLPRPAFNIPTQRLSELGFPAGIEKDHFVSMFEKLGGGNDPTLCRLRTLQVGRDASGRGALPAEAFSDGYFK